MVDDEKTGDADLDISVAMDLPEVAGKCAFLGSYIENGEMVCYFGQEYRCVAPRLVPTGETC